MNFECKLCKIKYSSRSGLWKHNNKFHKSNTSQEIKPPGNVILSSYSCNIPVIQTSYFSTTHIDSKLSENYNCRKCNKLLSSRQSRHKHEKICNINNELLIIKKNYEELKNDIKKIKNCSTKINNININNNIIDNSKKIIINYSPGAERAKFKIKDFKFYPYYIKKNL